jgi:hypothetical protein
MPIALEAMATAVVTEEQLIPVIRKIAIALGVVRIPYLVARDAGGQIETVPYQKLTPMLLNELQKQQNTIDRLEQPLSALESAWIPITIRPQFQPNISNTAAWRRVIAMSCRFIKSPHAHAAHIRGTACRGIALEERDQP